MNEKARLNIHIAQEKSVAITRQERAGRMVGNISGFYFLGFQGYPGDNRFVSMTARGLPRT